MKQEEIDARLFDLIASTNFEDLSNLDQAFVLSHMTEAEYRLHGTIQSAAMAEEVTIPAPTPLVIPRAKTVWYKRSIPLYQVISGAAVLLLCFWVLRNPETTSPRVTQPVKNNTTASQIIYDTIVREIPVIQTAIRYVHDTVKEIQYELYTLAPNREIQVAREIEPIPLTDALLKSKAPSLKEDKSSGLLTQTLSSDRLGN
jgi:hypothetical protein